MDLKATALLKLIYLEMLGHDMSWASFNVLEVMSSAKYHQKRVGYLGAVQTFRPDTEVLMLATNLLKKDLSSPSIPTMSLAITTLPHIITPSLALSLQNDLLPRLSHSHASVRKKTVVTLYRLALVYPETLLAAWPKIKERLMNKDEDPSVTAAIVNVICELGWRRPHDFLPLAPRLFDLLVEGGNNWMAIKLIKLFATLTPLEPRLIRKLLPPLTEIIRTTPAMSLLYECINGIIEGGILGGPDDVTGREEIASLCVDKLRSMIMVDGDPNLKYVALLAFNKIVVTHPFLVSQQEDVILECIDSADITIRIKALDLVQGMVTSDNLIPIVSRLMKQLKASAPVPNETATSPLLNNEEDDEEDIEPRKKKSNDEPPLPDDYRADAIGRILTMCSQNNYTNIVDFDWYIDVLTQLVRMAPIPHTYDADSDSTAASARLSSDVCSRIGDELRNVAVKVKAMRPSAVSAAEAIIRQINTDTPTAHIIDNKALASAVWVVGEYGSFVDSADDALGTLLQVMPRAKSPSIIAICLQAATKIFSLITADSYEVWTPERKSRISLLMARVIHVFEPFASHPSLEVQERAVEFIELLKLTAEAVSGQPASTDSTQQDPPLLLTQAIPSLFNGWELNSVAAGAQKSVPIPEGLNLDEPIHPNLEGLLSAANVISLRAEEPDEFDIYYHQKPPPTAISSEPAINRLAEAPQEEIAGSYQQASEESYLDSDIVARRKAQRRERARDDPFYIQDSSEQGSGRSTPIHRILQSTNGPDLDIDAIPIMQLDLGNIRKGTSQLSPSALRTEAPRVRQKLVITADETLSASGGSTPRYDESGNNSDNAPKSRPRKPKQGILQVSSSGLGTVSLEGGAAIPGTAEYEVQKQDEAEMLRAMREVERLRLEMQRANERIQVAQGVDVEGTIVKKKKKVVKKTKEGGSAVPKKKKVLDSGSVAASTQSTLNQGEDNVTAVSVVAPKKKKKKTKMAQIQDE